MMNKKPEKSMTAANDTRIALLEQSIGHINETLVRIEKRLDDVENEMKIGFRLADNKVEAGFKELRQEISVVNQQAWAQFRWIMGSFGLLFAGSIVTLILKSMHLLT